MVDVTLEESAGQLALVKLQADAWELNIRAPLVDLVRLREIRRADWEARRSLAVGTCANARVFWTVSEGQAAILVGPDDEAWDIAVTIPMTVVDEIARLAGGSRC
ncbi:hypothetical protein OIE67_43310 [Nonomuraea fuscirosea]|uniref:hypothetical protein n=1 Tax=Nonomuraea fuscirosea TaxID=1291556 RepID=UPI002DD826BF|nr:hypothetical protein [Nonomuraea fuscirosea]WSA50829.1 hypothetical protein OIE67_43310 [Nonomuraea fuscirosea]